MEIVISIEARKGPILKSKLKDYQKRKVKNLMHRVRFELTPPERMVP